MTIYNRPDEKVFASGAKPGELVPFPDVERGWGVTLDQTEGKPPLEWMNAAFSRLNEYIRYFMQRGLSEWSGTEDYPVNAYVQHGGKIYQALQANTETEPGTSASVWVEHTPAASTTIKGLIEIATAAEAKALNSGVLAITPATLGTVINDRGLIPCATFAEIVTLTSDQGPIVVSGMNGMAWEWVSTPYFEGYRSPMCGEIIGGNTVSPRSYQILATGGVWDQANEKDRRVISHFREQGLVVHIDDWIPRQGMIASLGGGLWKAPDLQDVFLRMSGTDADTANARSLGEHQHDAFQGFALSAYVGGYTVNLADGTYLLRPWSSSNASLQKGTIRGITNGGYGDPRISIETRPEGTTVMPFIHV